MSKETLLNSYWVTHDLKNKSAKEGISLNPANSNNDIEFYNYGCRLGNWLADNLARYSNKELMHAHLLEIGCGMGRLMFPLTSRCKFVSGVDISRDVLEAAQEYFGAIPNYQLLENNGENLDLFEEASFDMAFTSGVLQHIVEFDIIISYIKEALRVIKTGGIFLFSFQVWQTAEKGEGRIGAKLTAAKLTDALKDEEFEILELNTDPLDPIPHFCVILRKGQGPGPKDFSEITLTERPWRPALWEGLESMENHRALMKNGQRKITFYE